MDEIEIHANGLLLRPWQPADAPAVARACQDPEIGRWTPLPSPYLPEHAEKFVGSFTRQSWTNGTAAPFGVFDPETGEVLGSNGLVSIARGAGEVGYWIAPWARGRGIATRSTHAVATWSLTTLGLDRLAWRATIGNHASRLVAQRLGFQLEGVQRAAGWRRDLPPVDLWSAALVPGQLRSVDAPVDPILRRQALLFGAPQPRLQTTTAAGAPVTLRPLAATDVDAVVAAAADDESVRWTSVPSPYGRPDAQFFITEHAPGRWARGDGVTFAIADADDAYAGSMELRLLGGNAAEVGYLVAPWSRGKGLASAALDRLCHWAFESLGLHRIEWRAYLGNDASRRVALRAGFRMEGVLRAGCIQRGAYRDAWVGSRLATDEPATSTPDETDVRGEGFVHG